MTTNSAVELCREGFDRIDVGSMLGSNEIEEAIRCFDEALSINPIFALAWAGKASAFERMRRFDEALACYDRALELDGEDVAVLSNKGLMLEGLGKFEEAIKCYERALELDGGNAILWYNKGVSYDGLGEQQKAICAYRESLERDDTDPECWQNLGADLADNSDLDEAVACFGKALSIRPGYQAALENRGRTYLRRGDTDRAIADFEKAYPAEPERIPPRRCPDRKPTDEEIALFREAVDVSDIHALSDLLGQCPSLAQATNGEGYRFIDIAAAVGSMPLLELLARHSADLDIPAADGRTAFHAAAECANLETLIWLKSRGARIDHPDNRGLTPLHWTVIEWYQHSLATAALLLKWQPNLVESEDDNGSTPLMLAITKQNVSMVGFLLENGADAVRVSEKTEMGITAFMVACIVGNREIIDLMLDRGVPPNPRLRMGCTMFELLESQGKTDVKEYLAERIRR